MKQLTTKQAWLLIAREFDKVAHGGTSTIAQYTRWGNMPEPAGLCIATSNLLRQGRITFGQEAVMDEQSAALFKPQNRPTYWWPLDADGNAARAVAAQLLAEGAAD